MSDKTVAFTIDGAAVSARPGQTILQAADEAGIYIPRLCRQPELAPHGSCRVCVVRVDGRPDAACTRPAGAGMVVENDTAELRDMRRAIVEMLLVEGNHYCMFCEKSGNCELQALAYRFGIAAPRYPYFFPSCELDASHPDIYLDRNRCILCNRCVAASRDLDAKDLFAFTGRSQSRRLDVNADAGLAGTAADAADRAVGVCPMGALMRKRGGYAVPIGQRAFDRRPIGSDVEDLRPPAPPA